MWLLRTRSTLDQCGVHADALLHFTPMHKVLRVQLPDLRHLDCRVDFSSNTFRSVVNLCKDLGIRHPEELSFCKQLESQHLKKNFSSFPKAKFQANEYEHSRDYISPAADTNSFIPTHSTLLTASNGSLDSPNGPFSCAPYQPSHHQTYPRQNNPIGSPTGVSTSRKRFSFTTKSRIAFSFINANLSIHIFIFVSTVDLEAQQFEWLYNIQRFNIIVERLAWEFGGQSTCT